MLSITSSIAFVKPRGESNALTGEDFEAANAPNPLLSYCSTHPGDALLEVPSRERLTRARLEVWLELNGALSIRDASVSYPWLARLHENGRGMNPPRNAQGAILAHAEPVVSSIQSCDSIGHSRAAERHNLHGFTGMARHRGHGRW